ncbi:MAG: AI-2E family transporter [Fibrobacterota bacterium]
MSTMHLSFQKSFYVIGSIIGLCAVLILAKAVLIPIAFAFLTACILFPATRKMESWGTNEPVAALLSILGVFLVIGTTVFLFSSQILQLSDSFTDFKVKYLNVMADATLFINENIEFLPPLEKGDLLHKIQNWVNKSAGTLVSKTFSSTANITFGLITSIIYTFLILIYKRGLVRGLLKFYPQKQRDRAFKMLQSVQQVGQQYLLGMMIVVLILGCVNSFGLWIIGLDTPFLFGFLAAFLALIPYAGTSLGAAIPVFYSILSYDSIWMPITIAAFFWCVQVIESNFLTPKIAGGSLQINPLSSILAIVIGASVWGIAGMILFLPLAAMVKVVCEEYEELKPLALLIGQQNYHTQNADDTAMEKGMKRIRALFSFLKK